MHLSKLPPSGILAVVNVKIFYPSLTSSLYEIMTMLMTKQ